MTMRITRLTTYWNAEEADTVITFLDELKNLLWEVYGEQITDMRRSASEADTNDIDDDIDI